MDAIIEAIDRSPETMIFDPGQFEPSVDVVDIPSDFKITSASKYPRTDFLSLSNFGHRWRFYIL